MRYNLCLLFFALIMLSCNEDIHIGEFHIEVLGKGLDCGDLFVVEILNHQKEFYQEVETSAFDQAYVLGLDEEFKKSGLRMRVIFRKPAESDQLRACTTMGPGYPNGKNH